MEAISAKRARVVVIDDDESVRKALSRLLRTSGLNVDTFDSAQAFLAASPFDDMACIITDLRMPGVDGLDLQAELARRERDLPVVFITGHGDVPTSVQAMKAGAVDFLRKPFTDAELLRAVSEAVERNMHRAAVRQARVELRRRHSALTPRERDVLALVVCGLPNKVIGARLGATEKTIKVHRGRVMEKMQAGSLADLVRMAEHLGISAASD